MHAHDPLPLSIAAALLSLCLLPAAAAPAVASHGDHDDGPDQIALPIGWQPEGVTTDGKKVFSGSLATGSILKANPRTGETRVLPESATGKPAVGLDFDKRRDVIWVAGGPSGEVRAQDAKTGELLATYTTPPGRRRAASSTTWSSPGRPSTPPTPSTRSSSSSRWSVATAIASRRRDRRSCSR